MPAGVYLLFLFFPLVVQPILLVQEQLAAHAAPDYVVLVCIAGMLHEIVIAPKPLMAVLTLVLLAMEETHMGYYARRWL